MVKQQWRVWKSEGRREQWLLELTLARDLESFHAITIA